MEAAPGRPVGSRVSWAAAPPPPSLSLSVGLLPPAGELRGRRGGPGSRGGFVSGGGGGAGDERSRARVLGGGGGLARLRLVARSRHYAGRHFLSDPGEERLGAAWRLERGACGSGRGRENSACGRWADLLVLAAFGAGDKGLPFLRRPWYSFARSPFALAAGG